MSGDRPRFSGRMPRSPRQAPEESSMIEVEFEPTLADLSLQVGKLVTQMGNVLSAITDNTAQTEYLASRVDSNSGRIEHVRSDVNDKMSVFHRELVLLRETQVKDHAPRIRDVEVEQKETKRSMAPAAKAVGKYSGVALGPWVIFEIIAAIQQHAGPIQNLLKSLGILK